jgi:multidrug efflux pump subunit AcrA (membrane-fusion protein)
MSANIKIMISRKKVLAIPSEALEYSNDGKVYVITGFNDKKEPIKKEIKIGKDYDNLVEIKEGLKEGDKIYFKVKKYQKQTIDSGTNPFMFRRTTKTPKQIMRRI